MQNASLVDENDNYRLYELDWNNNNDNFYIDSAIEILCDEWGGTHSSRKQRIYNDHIEGNKNYVFMNNEENIVIGYVSLKKGINKQNQNIGNETIKVVILYNVVIRKDYRGLGLGSILMKLLEKQIQNDNIYSYIYLFTHTALGFYEKLKYHRCDAIDNDNKALNNLNNEAIDKINNIFLKRLTTSIESNEKHIWYRKRMKHNLQFKIISNAYLISQIHNDTSISIDNIHLIQKDALRYFEQVGPSCGIAAISSVLMTLSQDYQINISESIMNEAILRQYSNDGEIFDINHLLKLAKLNVADDSNYDIRIECIDVISNAGKFKYLCNNDDTIIIIPYDKGNENHQPCLKEGKNSHYAYIIGYIEEDDSQFKLIAMHSLSQKPIIATLHDFLESNKNLHYYNRSKEYLISMNGPNLNSKILIITKV